MIAVDTSVLVAAFAAWHEAHELATAALSRRPRLPAHVLLETFSVLTRLPPPHRAPGELVDAFFEEHLRQAPLTLPASEQRALVSTAVKAGIAGGAIYDALVAATAKHAGATLLSRDRRALITYELVGVRYEMLG